MTNLSYLPYIIPFMVICFAIVIAIILLLFQRQESRITSEPSRRPTWASYLQLQPFHCTYNSVNPYGGSYFLLFTRLLSFGYICGISGLWNFIRNDWDNLFYFTHWNVIMISVYYACAIVASLIGISFRSKLNSRSVSADGHWLTVEAPAADSLPPVAEEGWSVHVQRLNCIIQVLFEVAGASALFVTVVAFVLLNPKFEFWNVSDHFVTSCTFLAEMAQNCMVVRWQHLLLHFLWPMAYLVYIWPAVGFGAVTNWPYDFLSTANAGCFVWYTMLFLGDALFYYIWYSLSRLKYEHVFATSETAKEALVGHFRGTGARYDSGSDGSGGSGASTLNQSARGMLSAGSTHELASQESPVRKLGGGADKAKGSPEHCEV
jgi:hypothetical protein